MGRELLTHLVFNGNQAVEMVLEHSLLPPANPTEGQVYYNTATRTCFFWDGFVWVPMAAGASNYSDSSTVEPETGWGQAASAGVEDTEFSRGDHTHGTPPDPRQEGFSTNGTAGSCLVAEVTVATGSTWSVLFDVFRDDVDQTLGVLRLDIWHTGSSSDAPSLLTLSYVEMGNANSFVGNALEKFTALVESSLIPGEHRKVQIWFDETTFKTYGRIKSASVEGDDLANLSMFTSVTPSTKPTNLEVSAVPDRVNLHAGRVHTDELVPISNPELTSKSYVDGEVSSAQSAAQSYADSQDDAHSTADRQYTDDQDAAHVADPDPHVQYLKEVDHTKAAHDALLIDAATLDGLDSTSFLRSDSNDDVDGTLTFNALPNTFLAPTIFSHLTNKQYVDDEVSSAQSAAQSYADTEDDAHSAADRLYADQQDSAHSSADRQFAVDQDDIHSAADRQYTDDQDAAHVAAADPHTQYLKEVDHTKAAHDALNIDADTLDGLDSTQFLRSDVTDTHTGPTLVTTGNLKVKTNVSIDVESFLPTNGTQKTWAYLDHGVSSENIALRMKGDDPTDRISFFTDYGTTGSYTERMSIIAQTGLVGINDTTPTYQLDVGGDINAQGDVRENGTALSSKYLGIAAKAADSNLLDGLDSTQFLRGDVSDAYTGATLDIYNVLRHAQLNYYPSDHFDYLRAPSAFLMGDKIAFKMPYSVEYHNGTNWVAWSTNIETLTDGKGTTGVTIDQTHKRFRLVYQVEAYSTARMLVADLAYNFPSGGTLKVESSTDPTFATGVTTRLTKTDFFGAYTRVAQSNDHNNDTYLRIEFDTSVGATSVQFYGLSIFCVRRNAQGHSFLEGALPFGWSLQSTGAVNINTTGALTSAGLLTTNGGLVVKGDAGGATGEFTSSSLYIEGAPGDAAQIGMYELNGGSRFWLHLNNDAMYMLANDAAGGTNWVSPYPLTIHLVNKTFDVWSGDFIVDADTSITANQPTTFNSTAYFNSTVNLNTGSILNHNTSASYDKIRVWNNSTYAIGMNNALTYGGLGGKSGSQYAMTFTMGAGVDRGFLWRDSSHGASEGAMSLDLEGHLHVREKVTLGQGGSTVWGVLAPWNQLMLGTGVPAWIFVKTLPVSTASTSDVLSMEFRGGDWTSNTEIGGWQAEFKNRGGFGWSWSHDTPDMDIYPVAYDNGDGTVSIYIKCDESYSSGHVRAIYDNYQAHLEGILLNGQDGGDWVTVEPTGTLVFDGHDRVNYPANRGSILGSLLTKSTITADDLGTFKNNIVLSKAGSTSATSARLFFRDPANSQDVEIVHNPFDAELPEAGYGLWVKSDPAGVNNQSATLTVEGNIYANNTNRVLTTADEGAGNGLDADTLDGVQGANYERWNAEVLSAAIGPGWMTIGEFATSRGHAEFYIYDTESSDHAFMHIEAYRSFVSAGATVLASGGHAARITGVRWMEETADQTYGNKKLQVYVTANSVYTVRIKNHDKLTGWTTVSQPVPTIEGAPAGYQVQGIVQNLDHEYGSLATTGELQVGQHINAVGGVYENGTALSAKYLGIAAKAADSELLDGLDSTAFLRSNASDSYTGTELSFGASSKVSFGSTTRQMIDLWSTSYAIGIQNSTLYLRTGSRFSIHKGGVHNENVNNPGTGGTNLFTITDTEIKYLTNTIWHSGNDGGGSGLDADTLDGVQGSSFLRNNTSNSFASGTLTFNAGTTLDADIAAAVRVPTVTAGDSSTKAASTAFVQTAVTDAVAAAGSGLDPAEKMVAFIL